MITYVQILLVLYILWDIFHLFSGGAKVVGSHASGIFGKLFKKKNGGGGGSGESVNQGSEESHDPHEGVDEQGRALQGNAQDEVVQEKKKKKEVKAEKKTEKRILSEFLLESTEKRLLEISAGEFRKIILLLEKWKAERQIKNKGEVVKIIDSVKKIENSFKKEKRLLRRLKRGEVRAHSYLKRFYQKWGSKAEDETLKILDGNLLIHYNKMITHITKMMAGFEVLLRGENRKTWYRLNQLENFPVGIRRGIGPEGYEGTLTGSSFAHLLRSLSAIQGMLGLAYKSHQKIEKELEGIIIELRKVNKI